MNLIVCSEKCIHQTDGYCCLEGNAHITNALSSPCCYFEQLLETETASKENEHDKNC